MKKYFFLVFFLLILVGSVFAQDVIEVTNVEIKGKTFFNDLINLVSSWFSPAPAYVEPAFAPAGSTFGFDSFLPSMCINGKPVNSFEMRFYSPSNTTFSLFERGNPDLIKVKFLSSSQKASIVCGETYQAVFDYTTSLSAEKGKWTVRVCPHDTLSISNPFGICTAEYFTVSDQKICNDGEIRNRSCLSSSKSSYQVCSNETEWITLTNNCSSGYSCVSGSCEKSVSFNESCSEGATRNYRCLDKYKLTGEKCVNGSWQQVTESCGFNEECYFDQSRNWVSCRTCPEQEVNPGYYDRSVPLECVKDGVRKYHVAGIDCKGESLKEFDQLRVDKSCVSCPETQETAKTEVGCFDGKLKFTYDVVSYGSAPDCKESRETKEEFVDSDKCNIVCDSRDLSDWEDKGCFDDKLKQVKRIESAKVVDGKCVKEEFVDSRFVDSEKCVGEPVSDFVSQYPFEIAASVFGVLTLVGLFFRFRRRK